MINIMGTLFSLMIILAVALTGIIFVFQGLVDQLVVDMNASGLALALDVHNAVRIGADDHGAVYVGTVSACAIEDGGVAGVDESDTAHLADLSQPLGSHAGIVLGNTSNTVT